MVRPDVNRQLPLADLQGTQQSLEIWQVALREPSAGTWEMLRFGCLERHQGRQRKARPRPGRPWNKSENQRSIARKPPMVLYRGNHDDRVWIHDLYGRAPIAMST